MLETKYLMISGELHFVKPADSSDVDGGKYDVVVRATDGGKPPLQGSQPVILLPILVSRTASSVPLRHAKQEGGFGQGC